MIALSIPYPNIVKLPPNIIEHYNSKFWYVYHVLCVKLCLPARLTPNLYVEVLTFSTCECGLFFFEIVFGDDEDEVVG